MGSFYDEDFEDEFEMVTMTDDDGNDVEFVIIDNVRNAGERYLLVVERELMDDDETDAIILKEVSIDEEDVTYELVEEEAEFDKVADLFAQNDGEYDVRIDEE